jgi:hypothetical protein
VLEVPVTLPAWAPQPEEVAVHVPTRTRAVGVDDTYTGTFSTDTTPTAAQANSVIDQACIIVTSVTGIPIVAAAYDACKVAAALRAAYMIELGYPERDADVQTYEQLGRAADQAEKNAERLNTAAGGGYTTDPTPADTNLVVSSFPAAPAWADVAPGIIW